jgi:hypothetical protein
MLAGCGASEAVPRALASRVTSYYWLTSDNFHPRHQGQVVVHRPTETSTAKILNILLKPRSPVFQNIKTYDCHILQLCPHNPTVCLTAVHSTQGNISD